MPNITGPSDTTKGSLESSLILLLHYYSFIQSPPPPPRLFVKRVFEQIILKLNEKWMGAGGEVWDRKVGSRETL